MKPAYGRARNRFGLRLVAFAAAGVILVAGAFAYARADSSGEQAGSVSTDLQRLRAKMGVLRGRAHVDGRVVCEGQMTFALGEVPAP